MASTTLKLHTPNVLDLRKSRGGNEKLLPHTLSLRNAKREAVKVLRASANALRAPSDGVVVVGRRRVAADGVRRVRGSSDTIVAESVAAKEAQSPPYTVTVGQAHVIAPSSSLVVPAAEAAREVVKHGASFLRKTMSFVMHFLIYLALVGGFIWGLPWALSNKLGTQFPIAAITSNSMWPLLERGDLVLIKAAPREALAVGDIIVWTSGTGFTIHRVARLGETTLSTKGDANFNEDEAVSYDAVVGKTVLFRGKPLSVPALGYVSIIGARIRSAFQK